MQDSQLKESLPTCGACCGRRKAGGPEIRNRKIRTRTLPRLKSLARLLAAERP